MGTILAIDPGNIQSGYVIVEHDGEGIRRVLDAGKKGNNELLPMLERKLYGNGYDVAIEMIGYTAGKKSWICAAHYLPKMQTSGRPSLTATRPASRTSERERKRIPVSFTASQRICGRRWR